MTRQKQDNTGKAAEKPDEFAPFTWQRPRAKSKPFGVFFSQSRLRESLRRGALMNLMGGATEQSDSLDVDAIDMTQVQAIGRTGGKLVSYEPLRDHPALFETFVNLEDTAEAFAEFANVFGPLLNLQGAPEPVALWRAERAAMRAVVEVIDAVQNKRFADLKRWLSVETDGDQQKATLRHPLTSIGPLTWWPASHEARLRSEMAPETLLRITGKFAALEIRKRLEGRLLDANDERTQVHASIEAAENGRTWANTGVHFRVVLRPRALNAAMWLQVAFLLAGHEGVEVKRCLWCKTLAAVGGSTGRNRGFRFCKEACYKAHTRAQQRRSAKRAAD